MGMTTPMTAAARERSSRSAGRYQRWTLRALLLLGLFAFRKESLVLSSIHEVHGKTTGCRYTERMFADGHGPFRIGGRSVVAVNATIRTLHDSEVSDAITVHRLRDYFDFAVVVVSYSDVDRFKDIDEHSICARNFSDLEEGNRDGMLYGEFHAIDEDTVLDVATVFYPVNSGLQVVLMVPCWKQKSESFGYPVSTTEYMNYPMIDPLLSMDATISFRNPYGYLPALLYGLFPFNGVLSLLYGFVDICFILLINRYRQSAIAMQYFLLVVLLLATGESVSWFFTYKMLNSTGETVCCPYPGMVIFSTLVKIMAGMVARVTTTLICLGYGVVRPCISWPEIFVVTGLGVCYFIAVGALEISHILSQSDGDVKPPAVWEFLVIVTNACFGGWIFTSLALTKKNLAAFGQSAKLNMYTRLNRILYGYVLISFFLMAFEGAVYSGAILMDWKWIWIIWAAHRLLVFSVLVVVTIIWRPRPNSLLYSQMDQVPNQELDTPGSTTSDLAR
uniref:GOST seven transmembrane domain-containing protein n=1 Tax=Globisporangium ultimum (strain ATCC 200006 / CBS 805.95 / DAOM BR144) TaxID=431595 RepID=K3WZQ0_GLOUD